MGARVAVVVPSLITLWMVAVAPPPAQAQAQHCPKPPEGYTHAEPEKIEGGKVCYIKSEGGTPIRTTVVWDEPDGTSAAPKRTVCEVPEAIRQEMWLMIQDDRRAAPGKKTDAVQMPRTFAVAFVLDETCQIVDRLDGAFIKSKDAHAERQILEQFQLDNPHGQHLKPGYTVLWMIDQQPCQHPKKPKPKAGYCTPDLKTFPKKYAVDQRVYVAGPVKVTEVKDASGKVVKKERTILPEDVKRYAVNGVKKAEHLEPKAENFMELSEFTFFSR